MDRTKAKNKDDGRKEKESGKVKGHETDTSSKSDKEEVKSRGSRGAEDREPITRRSALMRTPPAGKASPHTGQRDSSAGQTLEGKPHREDSGRDRDQEKRKRKEDSPVEGLDKSREDGNKGNQEGQDRKSKTVIRSPLKKIERTGSFSDIEEIISRKSMGKREGNENKKRRIGEEERASGASAGRRYEGRRSTVQILKQKLISLEEEVERDILKTAEIDTLMREVRRLVDQLETEEIIRLEEEKDDSLKQRRVMNGLISEVKEYEDFEEIEGMDWPEECMSNVLLKAGRSSMGERDIVLWRCKEDPEMEKGVNRKYRDSFPELVDMEGKTWETLTLKSKRVIRWKGEEERERRIHITKEAEGRELFGKLVKLRKRLGEIGNVNKVVMNLEEYVDEVRFAKMVECVWRGTETKVEIFTPRICDEGDEAQKVHKTNAIMVRVQNGNYAETLKKVKGDLIKEGVNTGIQKIRSTRSGEMIIELKEGDDGTKIGDALKKGEELEVRILQKDREGRKRYVIRDLDAVTTKDEIEETLQNTATRREEYESVKVISLRKAYGDTQTAIVQLTQVHGKRLQQGGGIRLGVVQAQLREWMELVRCFRCWEYGHRAPGCPGPDRTKHCLRCGMEGHEARICQGELFCPLCQRQGHKAGSGACPKMRDMLASLRKDADKRRRRGK